MHIYAKFLLAVNSIRGINIVPCKAMLYSLCDKDISYRGKKWFVVTEIWKDGTIRFPDPGKEMLKLCHVRNSFVFILNDVRTQNLIQQTVKEDMVAFSG
ncbi:hypothetical protein SDJN03_03883, partial [Cucurbita argyrosperma subsp. sororia]